MRFSIFILLVSLTVCISAGYAPADEITQWNGHTVLAGRALVALDPKIPRADINRNLRVRGFAVSRISTVFGERISATTWLAQKDRRPAEERFALITFDPQRDVGDALAALNTTAGVKAAWPDHIFYLLFTPNDPLYEERQSNLREIKMEQAWERTTGGKVIVAVIDTGYVQDGLTDPAPNLLPGYDFAENDDNPNDTEGHGTHVSNIIAEAMNNGVGTAGMAPNAQILPVKVFEDDAAGASEDVIIEGIDWAVTQGARVINMSLGGGGYNSITESSIDDAVAQGVVVVVASGNENLDQVSYPAAYDNAIAVGSCQKHDLGGDIIRSDFSNYGDALDLVAPGEDITAETIGDRGLGFYSFYGTSMSSPHVAAAAALVIAIRSEVTDVQQIRDALEQTAMRRPGTDWDYEIGWGEIDVNAAMNAFAGQAPNNPPEVSILADPLEGESPLTVSFQALASDSDGSIDRYLWSFSTGETYNTAVFTHVFKQAGEYGVFLSATDNDGESGSAQVTITVKKAKEESKKEKDPGCGG